MNLRVGTLILLAGACGLACGGPAERSLCAGQDSSSSTVRLAFDDEPGEPMVITGRVVVGKARRPVRGVRILAYHTNAEGRYSRDGSGYPGAYLCGVLRTDEEGRYRIATIRPGGRPNGPAAHVHFDLTMPWGDRYHDSVAFAGDPRLRDMTAGERWGEVRPVSVDLSGAQLVEKDFWIRH